MNVVYKGVYTVPHFEGILVLNQPASCSVKQAGGGLLRPIEPETGKCSIVIVQRTAFYKVHACSTCVRVGAPHSVGLW